MAHKRKHSQERHWLNREYGGMPGWGFVVAGLVFIGVGGLWAVKSGEPAPGSTWTPPVKVEASASPEPTHSATPPSVAFLGDSYTVGAGTSDDAHAGRWTAVVAEDLGWRASTYARGGTGYVNDGGEDAAYATRVDAIIDAEPDIVVVSGGRNDSYFAPVDVEAAALDVFRTLRLGLPDAQVVVLGSWWDDDEPTSEYTAVREAIASAAEAAGVAYVDAGEPLVGHPELISDDGVHPNDAGYVALAHAAEAALVGAGIVEG